MDTKEQQYDFVPLHQCSNLMNTLISDYLHKYGMTDQLKMMLEVKINWSQMKLEQKNLKHQFQDKDNVHENVQKKYCI